MIRLTELKRKSEADVARELGLDIEEVRRRRTEGRERLAEDIDLDELKKRLR